MRELLVTCWLYGSEGPLCLAGGASCGSGECMAQCEPPFCMGLAACCLCVDILLRPALGDKLSKPPQNMART